MSLRYRLALTTVLVGLPIALLQAWVIGTLRERDANEVLAEFTTSYMHSVGRAQCEAAPETWMGGGPPALVTPPGMPGAGFGLPPPPDAEPPRPAPAEPAMWPPLPGGHMPRPAVTLFAYQEDGTSLNPRAPRVRTELLSSLHQGNRSASFESRTATGTIQETLTRMDWSSGPCALVLTRRTLPPAPPLWLAWPPLLAGGLTVALAVLLAAGPLVRRIRKLTEQVRRSAQTRYGESIHLGGHDEIGDLAVAFTQAGQEIRQHVEKQEAREKTLRDFLENTTHDVMIPLTVLQGHLTTVRDQVAAGKQPDSTVVSAAMSEAHYLGSLMHNLALAAKIEAGEPAAQQTTVDLGAVIARVVARHSPLAREKQVSLDRALADPPLMAIADVTLVEQAISNVVLNAVRYNHPGGHVAVVLEPLRSGERFVVRVVDDGPGIPAEEMAHLKERHFRGNEARSRDPNGHGLGLHIAWRAVQMHGWELRLSPSEYGGLQVEIEGPVAPTGSRAL